MTDLQKFTSCSILKKIISESNELDSDPMRLVVLLL